MQCKPARSGASQRGLLARAVLVGPDPVVPERPDEITAWDTLVTWPTRLLAVAGAVLVGVVWMHSPAGIQLAWALQYGVLVAVSVLISLWLPVFSANLVIAAAWLGFALAAPRTPDGTWRGSEVITWINRQIGHIEALATWGAVALVVSHCLPAQLGCLAGFGLLGPPTINRLARTRWFGGERARINRAGLMMERRSLIYLATAVGLAILAVQARHQLPEFLPLFLTVAPALLVRYVRFRHRKAQCEDRADAEQNQANRLLLAEMQRRAARATGWLGPAVVAAAFGLATGISVAQRNRLAAAAAAQIDAGQAAGNVCTPERGGPREATLAVFLLADTQIHALGGQRFPGQLEVANALVPVCRRPVELDMLSTAAVIRSETVYKNLAAQRDNAKLRPPLWAHLGDLADLACASEMDRMIDLLRPAAREQNAFVAMAAGQHRLAGIAPGNHDSNFQGNFGWSPYWDGACAGRRLDKRASDERIAKLLAGEWYDGGDGGDGTQRGTGSQVVQGRAAGAFFETRPGARFTITRLGTLRDDAGRSRGVLAIFIDTSDRLAQNFGLGGSFGSFSSRQREAILAAVEELERDRSDAWADPWYVMFGHVPYDELTATSRDQLARLITALDGRAGRPGQARVITLVTAHTHVAGSHRLCIGQRLVREIVVGSVIDPPQQAAVLEIGYDARGRASARISSLPTVARDGMTCASAYAGPEYATPAAACRDVVARLAVTPACQDLVSGNDDGAAPASRTCAALERPLSLADQLDGIARYGGPDDPLQLAAADGVRARALLGCLCRDGAGGVPATCGAALADPFAEDAYAPIIAELAHRDEPQRIPPRQTELTCLAWAAAVVQAHKANGMTMADAARCAFDDATLPPAQVTVAVADETPCH